MNSLPEKLRERQEHQRQSTINLVLRAIAELTVEGYSIKIKDLMERTELSRSVFAKPHIRDILISHRIATKEATVDSGSGHTKTESMRVFALHDKLRDKDARISALANENEALRDECALLRGRLFLLMQRMEMIDPNKRVDFPHNL